jgi:hypothetical protein
MEGGVEVKEEMDSRGNDSNHNSIITARATNGGLASASLLVENDDAGGVTNPQTVPDKVQNQIIEDYIAPLVEKAEKVLGREIPRTIVRGVHDGLLLQVEEVVRESFSWENFESILEEVCQECDQDTWFDIQEAFSVGWEDNEIQKMGGDLDDQDHQDQLYDQ